MPNLIDLAVSTPVKVEPEVKPEQVPMANVARSLPIDGTSNEIVANESGSSSTTRSVTLGTETRSIDTSEDQPRPSTPTINGPPAKMRRCTRQSTRQAGDIN